MPEDYGRWNFTSQISSPDGIRVEVHISVPVSAFWDASGHRVSTEDALPPIAQMAAADAMKQLTNAKNEASSYV
jgi:hypothetical protein